MGPGKERREGENKGIRRERRGIGRALKGVSVCGRGEVSWENWGGVRYEEKGNGKEICDMGLPLTVT